MGQHDQYIETFPANIRVEKDIIPIETNLTICQGRKKRQKEKKKVRKFRNLGKQIRRRPDETYKSPPMHVKSDRRACRRHVGRKKPGLVHDFLNNGRDGINLGLISSSSSNQDGNEAWKGRRESDPRDPGEELLNVIDHHFNPPFISPYFRADWNIKLFTGHPGLL